MFNFAFWELIALGAFLLHVFGVAAALHAVVYTRTPQGAVAWAIMLVMFPYVTLPAYLVFGRGKFQGYVRARRAGDSQIDHIARSLEKKLHVFRVREADANPDYRAMERLAKMPFTSHNGGRLLVDGEATFDAIFRSIEMATDYILVQFFIIRSDDIGQELQVRLKRKASEGVRVYVLYDEIGCHRLPGTYCAEMHDAGIEMRPFKTSRGFHNRFQLNFRNHRKVVIVDGRVAFAGGHNVGDEYLGRSEEFGAWRDTHVEVSGPLVQAIQLAFMEDWHWATGQVPEMDWTPNPAEGASVNALALPSSPADVMETFGLFVVHAINLAKRRLWIATPYFVPDIHVVNALQLAALRGVDVRVLLPEKTDHWLVHLSAFSYIPETAPAGVKFYRYQPGFMHQKVVLVDDDFATVGTGNLDNRSIRLNFELTLLFADRQFAAAVHEMLDKDFAECRPAHPDDLAKHGWLFRMAVPVARLLAPVQ